MSALQMTLLMSHVIPRRLGARHVNDCINSWDATATIDLCRICDESMLAETETTVKMTNSVSY